MQPVQLKCPNCGALLDDAGGAETVTCAYCGGASRVQRRSRVFQLPMRPPPVRPGGPEQVARQVGSRVGAVATAVIALGLIAGGIGVVIAIKRGALGALGGG